MLAGNNLTSYIHTYLWILCLQSFVASLNFTFFQILTYCVPRLPQRTLRPTSCQCQDMMEVDQIPTKTEWFERIYYVHKLKLCCPFFLPQTEMHIFGSSMLQSDWGKRLKSIREMTRYFPLRSEQEENFDKDLVNIVEGGIFFFAQTMSSQVSVS